MSVPWIQFPGQWSNAEFDREKADQIIQAAMLSVGDEAMKPRPQSRVRGPSGEPLRETQAEYDRRIVGTAVLYLLEMGLLAIPDDAEHRLDDYLPLQRMP
jgi:hypothetical protein